MPKSSIAVSALNVLPFPFRWYSQSACCCLDLKTSFDTFTDVKVGSGKKSTCSRTCFRNLKRNSLGSSGLDFRYISSDFIASTICKSADHQYTLTLSSPLASDEDLLTSSVTGIRS